MKSKSCKICGGQRGISLGITLKYEEIKRLAEGIRKVQEGSEDFISIVAYSKKEGPMELRIGRHPEKEFMVEVNITVDSFAERLKRILEAEQD